jgi:hypothetical protein
VTTSGALGDHQKNSFAEALGRFRCGVDDALVDYEELFRSFHATSDLELQRQVAFALANRALTLDYAGVTLVKPSAGGVA